MLKGWDPFSLGIHTTWQNNPSSDSTPHPSGFTHNEIPPIHLLYNKQKMASGLMVDNDTLSVHCVSDRWPFYLETPRTALVLQPHSAVSNLSRWHCSIMHLPMCSPISTNVFSELYQQKEWQGGAGGGLLLYLKERKWPILSCYAVGSDMKEKTESLCHLLNFFYSFVCVFHPSLGWHSWASLF